MVHCAYNGMWVGQVMQPDWDMFKFDHSYAKFHVTARAISGGPIYASDSVGSHDFDLIRQLVFLDGTNPIRQHFALATRDCLFKNPLLVGETILKIWNLNKIKCSRHDSLLKFGVIGAFNCQGTGWDPKEERYRGYPGSCRPVSGSVHGSDVECDQKDESMEMSNAKEYAVYLNQAEEFLLRDPAVESHQGRWRRAIFL